jgi:hypothetical protein
MEEKEIGGRMLGRHTLLAKTSFDPTGHSQTDMALQCSEDGEYL